MGIFSAKKTKSSEDKQEGVVTDLKVVDQNVLNDEQVKEKSMKDLYSEESVVKNKSGKKNSLAYRVLLRPAVTEKATDLGPLNQYVFMVNINTNKIDISKAIFEVYGVEPLSVNIIKMKGKRVNRGRISGKRKDYKKAIITLKKGDSISIYEGV